MNEKLIIPGSIIVAGICIAIAVYMSNSREVPVPQPVIENERVSINAKKIDPATDRISGNPSAELFVIEYSDLACPFCKRYHDGPLKQLKEEFAEDERVAFVFRHFPLDEPYTRPVHPNATEQHIAAECVGKLAGNEAFFIFVDAMFERTPSNGTFDMSQLSEVAQLSGVNLDSFSTCYANQDTASIVSQAFEEGVQAGVDSTPTVYIQTSTGVTYPAAADYGVIKTGINAYFSELE